MTETNAERLERLQGVTIWNGLFDDDLTWLVEQAERALAAEVALESSRTEVFRLYGIITKAHKQAGEIRGKYGDYLGNVTLKVDDILTVRRTLEEAIWNDNE